MEKEGLQAHIEEPYSDDEWEKDYNKFVADRAAREAAQEAQSALVGCFRVKFELLLHNARPDSPSKILTRVLLFPSQLNRSPNQLLLSVE